MYDYVVNKNLYLFDYLLYFDVDVCHEWIWKKYIKKTFDEIEKRIIILNIDKKKEFIWKEK